MPNAVIRPQSPRRSCTFRFTLNDRKSLLGRRGLGKVRERFPITNIVGKTGEEGDLHSTENKELQFIKISSIMITAEPDHAALALEKGTYSHAQKENEVPVRGRKSKKGEDAERGAHFG